MSGKKILMVNGHIKFGGGDATFRLEKQIFEFVGYDIYTFSHEVHTDDYRTTKDFVY